MAKELITGIGACAVILWLTFFASPGAVQVATLVVAVAALIWFATVETGRLRDRHGRPHAMIFGLGAVAAALAITAAVFIATPTVFLVGGVILAGTVTGVVRAVRAAMTDH